MKAFSLILNCAKYSSLGIGGLVGLMSMSSCHVVSDQGPMSMNKIQKEQFEGKRGRQEFTIININRNTLARYNKKFSGRYGTIPRASASKMYNDNIRPYDQLTLLVIDTAEQGAFANSKGPVTFGPIEVPSSGTITIPYAGEFNVIGKSINSVQQEIKTKYANVFNTAEVSLNRTGRLPLRASVLGLAKNPGQHEINRKGVTVAEIISQSGGVTEEPYLCEYLIHRNNRTYTLNNKQIAKNKVLVQDGDLIEIKRRSDHYIMMMGSVKRSGNHKFPKAHCHLSDFLGEGSGIHLSQADATGVFVFRKVGGREHIYRFNIKEPEGLIYASKFNIHGGDIIYVTEAPLSKWGRVIRGILPFGQLQTFGNITR